MDKSKNCTACNIKLHKDNYKKGKAVCESRYNSQKRKNNNNTSHHNQKSEVLITITMTIEFQTLDKNLEPRSPKS